MDAATVVSVSPAQLSSLIRGRLAAGLNGQCAPAEYQALIDRIEAETRRDVE
jgi:hypothetical protein